MNIEEVDGVTKSGLDWQLACSRWFAGSGGHVHARVGTYAFKHVLLSLEHQTIIVIIYYYCYYTFHVKMTAARATHTLHHDTHRDDSVYALLEPTHAHTISAHTWHMHYRPIYPARTFVPRPITVVDRFPCTNKRLAVFWTRVCSHLTGSCLIEPTWR